MKAKKIQYSMLLNDPVRAKSKVEPVKLKSVVKFNLTDEQMQWAIGHNLNWLMGQIKSEGQS